MYNDNFKLIENPFGDLSNPKFVYLGGDYRFAFDNIRQAVDHRAGLILLTGLSGVGKTVIVDQLVRSLRQDATTILFQNKSGDQNLIRFICDALGLNNLKQEREGTQGESTKVSDFIENINELDIDKLLDFVNGNLNLRCKKGSTYSELLNQHLIELSRKQRNVVVLVDNVEKLSPELLDEALSLISKADKQKKIQFIVTCIPEVGKDLRERYAESIATTYRLSPLDSNLIEEYIMHLLKAAGFDGENPFSSDAMHRLLDYSKGIPSQINALCQSSIFTASFEGQKAISSDMIEAASLHQNYIEGVRNTTSSSEPIYPSAEEISHGLATLRGGPSGAQEKDISDSEILARDRGNIRVSVPIDEAAARRGEVVEETAKSLETPASARSSSDIIERLSEIQYKNSALRSARSDSTLTQVADDNARQNKGEATRNGLRLANMRSDAAQGADSANKKKEVEKNLDERQQADALVNVRHFGEKPSRNGLRVVKSQSDVEPDADATSHDDNETMVDAAEQADEAEINQHPEQAQSIRGLLDRLIAGGASKLPISLDTLVSPKLLYPALFLIGVFGYIYFAANPLVRNDDQSAAPKDQLESLEKFAARQPSVERNNNVRNPEPVTGRAEKSSKAANSRSGDQTVLRFADLNSNTQTLLPDLAEAYLKYTGAKKTSIQKEDAENAISVRGELTGVSGVRKIVVEKAGDAPILLDFINRDGIDFGISSQQLIGSNPFQDNREDLPDQRIIAIAGIAVIVHPANPAMIISLEQLSDVLNGLVTNWWQLDQKARGINVYLPVNNTSDFYEKILTRELGEMFYPNNVQRFRDESELAEQVAKDTNAVGIVRVPYIGPAKSIAIASPGEPPVLPSQANIVSNEYPFTQLIYLYANDSQDNIEYQQFTHFMGSETANRIIRSNGFIPFHSNQKRSSMLSGHFEK